MTSRTQPIEAPSGLDYGEHKALEDAQRAVPLPDNSPQQATSAAAPGGGGPVERPNVFGPTERENEPLTAGAAEGAGPSNMGLLPDDPASVLRAVYLQYPSPGLRRLLERMAK